MGNFPSREKYLYGVKYFRKRGPIAVLGTYDK